jgi:ankyrin repeat protein
MANNETMLEAARAGDTDKITALLAADAKLVNARNDLGQSAVLLAKYHRQDAVVQLLLGRNPILNIWEASAVGDSDRVMELLEADPKLLNQHSRDGFTPLGLAAFFGSETIAHNLMAKGANPNIASNNPMQVAPLHSAVAGGHMAIVRMLVESGANVNAVQQQGFTPLHGAANLGDELMVRYLLANGADPSARAENGQTAMDFALARGHQSTVNLL